MWYFAWILGLGLACAFAILNAMWFELRVVAANEKMVVTDSATQTKLND